MPLITSHQVWRQRKGRVRVRILWFCKAGHCHRQDELSVRHRYVNHVHVLGWHETTAAATNHSIIKARDLTAKWELVN